MSRLPLPMLARALLRAERRAKDAGGALDRSNKRLAETVRAVRK